MIAADFGAHLEQPGHVEPRERADDAWRFLRIFHGSSRAALHGCFSSLFGRSSAPGSRGGEMTMRGGFPSTSLRANGSCERAPDDRLREAIQRSNRGKSWI